MSSVHQSIDVLSDQLGGAPCLIYDASQQQVVYSSQANDWLSEALKGLDEQKGLERLFAESVQKVVQVRLKKQDVVLLIKRLSRLHFLTVSVNNEEQIISEARLLLTSGGQVQFA